MTVNNQLYKQNQVQVDGREINYKIAGHGQLVLILHGWGGSSDSWVKVLEILSGSGYRVVVPDFPGFGQSKAPAIAWGVGEYAQWLKQFVHLLRERNEISSINVIIGHSFGGRIAIKLLSSEINFAERLVLCGSAGIKPDHDMQTSTVYALASIGNRFFGKGIMSRFKGVARTFFYLLMRRKDYARAKGVMKPTMAKVIAEDLMPLLGNIESKTLVVWGQNDRMVPVKYASIFSNNLKNSRLEIIPGVGHSPHLEAPNKLSEIILKFLYS